MITWKLCWRRHGGDNEDLIVKIRRPTLSTLIPDTWSCDVSINLSGIAERPIFGATPLQAMSLAIFLANSELARLSKIGVVFDPRTRQPIPMEVFTAEAKRS